MFKFLKEKIKQSVSIFSKKVDEEGSEEVIEEKKESPKKEGFFKKIFKKKEDIAVVEEKSTAIPSIIQAKPKEKTEDKKINLSKTEKNSEIQETKEEKKIKKIAGLAVEKPKSVIKKETIDKFNSAKDKKQEDIIKKDIKIEIENDVEDQQPTISDEKRGFFERFTEKIVTKKINETKFDDLFWDLEMGLLENNVAVEVIEKIKTDLKNEIVDKPLRRNKIEEIIVQSLKNSIDDILSSEPIKFMEEINKKKPFVICFVGVNGSGKTTTIAKIAKMLLDNNKKVILAAADTFRAAAIDQLQVHADKLGIKMIKHNYGSDPAAVAFDAIKYAKAKGIDVVLIDTAGRLHSNINLVDEMKKIIRVANPDLKIFVGESITGNDCVEQAIKFKEAIDIDGIILSKADIDEKGGASISISYITKKPILFIGTGQGYLDIKPFNKDEIIEGLGLLA
jgi:fused signal recognition particle receptor